MLYGLFLSFFLFVCFLLILLIMIQKSKSSMGLGGLGGGTQMLFGGSGGQDVFQKATWVLGFLFMFGSLTLTILKSTQSRAFGYAAPKTTQQPMPMPAPTNTK